MSVIRLQTALQLLENYNLQFIADVEYKISTMAN